MGRGRRILREMLHKMHHRLRHPRNTLKASGQQERGCAYKPAVDPLACCKWTRLGLSRSQRPLKLLPVGYSGGRFPLVHALLRQPALAARRSITERSLLQPAASGQRRSAAAAGAPARFSTVSLCITFAHFASLLATTFRHFCGLLATFRH